MIEYSSETEAQQAAEAFQRLLGLTHWVVKIKLVPELENALGIVNSNGNKRQALIRLITREGYEKANNSDAKEFCEFDQEQTLVHELLHLHLAPLDPLIEENPLSGQIIENAVHALSIVIKQLLDTARRSSSVSSNSADNEPTGS